MIVRNLISQSYLTSKIMNKVNLICRCIHEDSEASFCLTTIPPKPKKVLMLEKY